MSNVFVWHSLDVRLAYPNITAKHKSSSQWAVSAQRHNMEKGKKTSTHYFDMLLPCMLHGYQNLQCLPTKLKTFITHSLPLQWTNHVDFHRNFSLHVNLALLCTHANRLWWGGEILDLDKNYVGNYRETLFRSTCACTNICIVPFLSHNCFLMDLMCLSYRLP